VPISWDELDDPDLRPDRWTMDTAVQRLRDRGDLFRPVLDSPQRLPRLA
jgi:bifunctional non-homologous end joining protein LigD